MEEIRSYKVLFLGQKGKYRLPANHFQSKLKYIYCDNRETINREDVSFVPDLILFDSPFLESDMVEGFKALKKEWETVPVVAIIVEKDERYLKDFYSAGIFDIVRTQHFEEDIFGVFTKILDYYERKENSEILINSISEAATNLQEKNTILQTSLDILSHDTKNLFFSLSILLDQLPVSSQQSLLKATFDELYNEIMEAVGYLWSKKRIYCVLDEINNLKLTSQRIPLCVYSRIILKHCSRYLLYIETSSLFKNAIINLIENALKYSPEQEPVTVFLERIDNQVAIHIMDKGPGIPGQEKENIFSRDYRLLSTRQIEGTGKGLWITKNIVEKEGGCLEVRDNENQGAVFTLKIPAFKLDELAINRTDLMTWFNISASELNRKEKALQTVLKLQELETHEDFNSILFATILDHLRKEKKLKNSEEFNRKLKDLKKLNPEGKTVLIIDDSIHVHYYLGSFLTEFGYRIVEFNTNGIDGISTYKDTAPDLVTLDFIMPQMSGIETARNILNLNPKAKILFLTALGDHPDFLDKVKTIFPHENYRILTKPVNRDILRKTVAQFLA
ncbi:MAG: response regulator [Spirochaetales bacterium]|nr:response regulator [Spirochaetales bacterium]